MKYSELVEVYEKLSGTTKKLEKTDILAMFLPKLDSHSEWIYLLRGRVMPDYDPGEFGISVQLSIKAIAKASGISSEKVMQEYRKIGDLGEIAEKLMHKKRQSTLFSNRLTVQMVFDNLRKLMTLEGKGSVERKMALISELLNSADGKEAKYIVRTLLNDLRVGVADAILREAIVKAFFPGKEMSDNVEEAYDKVNDFALVFELAKKGEKALHKVQVVPGKPLKVMLPVRVEDIDEAFRICGDKVAIEHKYDGFRVLVNKKDGKVSLFTRRLDNVTNQFPDIVEIVNKNIKAKEFVLDSEAVAYDPKHKRYLPFESLSQRIKRKYDIDKLIGKIPVELNVFDVLYVNGESKIDLPFIERRKLLEKLVKQEPFKARLAKQIVTSDKKEAMAFYKDAIKIGEEGIMVKKLDAPYRPGRRVGYIVKMKPSSADLDLVIVGAEYGTGKRAGGLTSYILACRENGKFLEVGKVSSGLKEKSEMGTSYKEMDALLQPLIIKEEGNMVHVKPKVVVSVTYQNVQGSPTYNSGYALRFPKITHYRPERGVYDIATIEDIKKEVAKGNALKLRRGS